MKFLLIFTTLLTLTACCACNNKSRTTIVKPANLACSTVKVSGMTCEACAMTVTENLKKLSGVKDVQVDVTAGTVKIFSVKQSDVKSSAVKSTIEKSGYTFNSLQSNCN